MSRYRAPAAHHIILKNGYKSDFKHHESRCSVHMHWNHQTQKLCGGSLDALAYNWLQCLQPITPAFQKVIHQRLKTTEFKHEIHAKVPTIQYLTQVC